MFYGYGVDRNLFTRVLYCIYIYVRLFMRVLFEDCRDTSSLFKFRTTVVLLTDLIHIVFTLYTLGGSYRFCGVLNHRSMRLL